MWYRTALDYKPPEDIQRMLENKVSPGVAQAIIENAELREQPQLRAVAFRYAIETKDSEVRRRLADEIADHLWPLTATEQRELETAARDAGRTAIELAGRIAVRACALPVAEETVSRKVTRNAGEQLRKELASAERDQWCMLHGAVVAAISLTAAFWFLVPVWMSTLHAKLGVQIIGDFIPPFVWIVGIVLVIPTWALRRQIHGLAVTTYPRAWRGFHPRFFFTTIVLIALLIGFAKAGGQVLQNAIVEGLKAESDTLQPIGYTLAHGIEDFVLSIGLATPCALAIWVTLPLVTRVVGETPQLEQLTLVDRLRRYGVAILLACGLPLITSSLLVLGIAHAMPSPCDLRIDNSAIAGIWVALVVGSGGIVAMASVGVHQASELLELRRGFARANAVPRVRGRLGAIMLAVALAIAGLSLTYLAREWVADRFDRQLSSSCFISEITWSQLE